MIALLQGLLYKSKPPLIIIECQGVGYEIEVLPASFYSFPENNPHIQLHIYHLIREDSQQLFGFIQSEEREMFRWLLRLSGIGAKTALAIISTFSWHDLASIIHQNEVEYLTKIPGIGKKTAERLFVDMKNKFPENKKSPASQENCIQKDYREVSQALTHLGYTLKEIDKAIKDLPTLPIDEMIKLALQKLAKYS